MTVRKVVTAATLTGSLALGAVGVVGTAGVAGASTPTTRCIKAEKVATRIEAFETKAAAWLPKAEAREAKAAAAGHTKVALAIARRVARVQKRQARGTALAAKIAAACGSSTTAT